MSVLKISRLEGLTDGVFAIAMTILVLDLRLDRGLSPAELEQALLHDIMYKLGIYVGSFVILGTLWIGMTFQIGLLRRINRPYVWTHVVYLMTICIVPFSAGLVANYPGSQICISFFAINLLCASLAQLLITQCAHYFELNNEYDTPGIKVAIVRRILLAPLFYLLALVVAPWSTHWAFVLLVLPILIYIKPGRVDQLDNKHEKINR